MTRALVTALLVLSTAPLVALSTALGAELPSESVVAIVDAVSENAHSIFDQIRNSAP